MTLRLALFGADSLEGEILLESLAEQAQRLDLLPVARQAAGDSVMFDGRPVPLRSLDSIVWAEVDAALFLDDPASDAASIGAALQAGVPVINASAIDASELGEGRQLEQLPDCVSQHIAALLALQPALDVRGIEIALTLPVSALGRQGIDALAGETARLLNAQEIEPSGIGGRLAFNTLCRQADGFAAEVERHLPALLTQAAEVYCQAQIVPVFYGYTAQCRLLCQSAPDLDSLEASLRGDARFSVCADGSDAVGPANLLGEGAVYIERLQAERDDNRAFRVCLIGDNLRNGRAGMALNSLNVLIKNAI